MPTIWQGDKNFSIQIDHKYSSPYDDKPYTNFANLMNKQTEARKYFLKPYHQVCIEDCNIPWQIDTTSVLKKINEVKKNISSDYFTEIVDMIENLASSFIRKTPLDFSRIFLPTINEDTYQRVITMNPEDSKPLNRFFHSVVIHSHSMKNIISMLYKNDVLLSSDLNFIWCNGCKNISIGKNNDCFYCKSPKNEIYPMFHFPQKILIEWINGGHKFLEAMTYHAIKKASSTCEIFSNVNVVERGRKPVTEIDVFIKKNKEKYCAILSTTNPTLHQEKREAKILSSDCKFDVILVTTSSNANEMGKNTVKNFLNVKKDSTFPSSLITFLKENQYID